MWPAGVCLGRAVRRSQFRVLHDDRTVQQRCDTDEHHPSAAASPRPVVAAGESASVSGERHAGGLKTYPYHPLTSVIGEITGCLQSFTASRCILPVLRRAPIRIPSCQGATDAS